MSLPAIVMSMPAVDLTQLKVQAIANLGEFVVREQENLLPLLFERCKTDEEIGTALFYIFDKFDQPKTLIGSALKEIRKIPRTELALTEYLRGNEITMTIFSKYLHTLGQRYLKKVVHPTIKKIISKYHSYEINPGRTLPENITKNLSNLVNGTTKLLNSVYKHSSELPMDLRELLFNLHTELNTVHAVSAEMLIGSTFFLRLLCPAITKPKVEDKKMDADIRRGMILMAKLVQLIANSTTELASDDQMKLTESFIKTQLPKARKFAVSVLDLNWKTTTKLSESHTHKYYEASVNHVYSWMFKHYEECENWMMKRGSLKRDEFQTVMDGMRKVTGSDPTFANDYQQVWKRFQSRINLHELGLVQRGDSRHTFSEASFESSSTTESTSEIDTEDASMSSSQIAESFSVDKPIMLKIFHEKNKKMQIMRVTMPSFANTMEWIQKQFDLSEGQAFRVYFKAKDGQRQFITDDISFTNILPFDGESTVQTLFIESIDM